MSEYDQIRQIRRQRGKEARDRVLSGRSGQSTRQSSSSEYDFIRNRTIESVAPPTTEPAPASRTTMNLPVMDVRTSTLARQAAAVEPPKPLPGRDIPVVGPILRGLDWIASNPVSEAIAEYTVPDAPILKNGEYVPVSNARAEFLQRSGQAPATGVSKVIGQIAAPFAVPGAGLGAGTGLYRASGEALDTVAPRIGQTLGGRVGREAALGVSTGAPLAAGVELSQGSNDLSQAGVQSAIGGALGVAIGAATPLVGRGIQALRDRRNVPTSTLDQGTVSSELRPILPESELTQIADEGLSRLAPETNPNIVSFDPRSPIQQTSNRNVRNQLSNERGLMNTMLESDRLTPEVRTGVEQSPTRRYEPITNQTTVNSANQRLSRGIDEAEAFALGGRGGMDAEQVATGFRLIDEFQRTGQVQRAVTMVERLAERLTEAGRTVQAASLWNRLTPEGALIAAQRKVQKINSELPKGSQQLKIDENTANDIMQAAGAIQRSGASQERAANVINIMDRLRAGESITDADRQAVADFIKDAQQFVKPNKTRNPRPAQPPREMKDKRVSDNVIDFLKRQEEAAKERLRAKGVTISSNPLDQWADYAIIGASKLAQLGVRGAVKFADWSAEMIRDFGEQIRPHLLDIYEKSVESLGSNVKQISQKVYQSASKSSSKLSEEQQEINQLTKELADKVKAAIEKSKTGNVVDDELQEIRNLSDELADLMPEREPTPPEKRFLQAVKSLSKKLSGVESPKATPDQSVKEVQKLLTTITKIADEGRPKSPKVEIDTASIEGLGYQLMERTKPRLISKEEKIAESFLKKNSIRLSENDIDSIRNLAQQVSELSGDAKRIASQDLQELLNKFEQVGVGKKLAAGQYIFMLLNPVTQIRNIVGNEIMYRLERLSRTLATPIDFGVSKLTGKDRQVTFLSGPLSWQNFFAPAQDYWRGLIEGGRAGWRGINPDGLTTAYDISGQSFRSKLNPMTYLEKTLGAVMKGFDYASYNRAVQQRLRESAYLDAINNGVKGREAIQRHISRYMANLDENISSIASQYGQYVTLQDRTALSTMLNNAKRGLNSLSTGFRSKEFGAGNLIIPFAKTPANLLLRAIDFSPAGFAKAILQTHDILRKPNTELTRADVIQSVTRALLGTGLTGVGLWLADKGVLRGESPTDRDTRELERSAGLSQYQINGSALQRMMAAIVTGNMRDINEAAKLRPGDTLWQYEWAQPTSMPLAVGANIVQERRQSARDLLKKGESESGLKQGLDVVTGAMNTLFNSSVLQGLQQALDVPPGEENKIKAFGENLLKQIPSMAVPSMVGRFNQLIDNAQRETYSPDFTEKLLNPAMSRVPGLAQDLPQRSDVLGQPMTRANTFFDVFLSPSQRSTFKPTREAQLVFDLLGSTGESKVVPRAVPRYITGKDRLTGRDKRIDLTGEQLVKYQTIVGQETAKRLATINPNMSDERKVKRVLEILNKAGEIGRTRMKKELGLR